MPEVKQHYNDMTERQAWVSYWEALGYTMLHDDFDADWKRGDEPHGTMTFTDVMPPEPPPVEPVRDLAKELDDLKVWAKTRGYIEITDTEIF